MILGGYSPPGTRARGCSLMEQNTSGLHGQDVAVRASIARMPALSGHADRSELLRWLRPLDAPKQVFLTHGELPSMTALAETLRGERQWNVTLPRQGQKVVLSSVGSAHTKKDITRRHGANTEEHGAGKVSDSQLSVFICRSHFVFIFLHFSLCPL